MRYAVIDKDGIVINIAEWNGITPYHPGSGLSLVPAADNTSTGDLKTSDGFVKPVPDVAEEQPQTLEARVAELEDKIAALTDPNA